MAHSALNNLTPEEFAAKKIQVKVEAFVVKKLGTDQNAVIKSWNLENPIGFEIKRTKGR